MHIFGRWYCDRNKFFNKSDNSFVFIAILEFFRSCVMWINMVDGIEVEVLLLFLLLLQMICLRDCVCVCVCGCEDASMRVLLHTCVMCVCFEVSANFDNTHTCSKHIALGVYQYRALCKKEQYAVNDICVDVDVCGTFACVRVYECAIVNSSTYVTCHVCAIHTTCNALETTHPLHSQTTTFVLRIRNVYHLRYALYRIGIAIKLN